MAPGLWCWKRCTIHNAYVMIFDYWNVTCAFVDMQTLCISPLFLPYSCFAHSCLLNCEYVQHGKKWALVINSDFWDYFFSGSNIWSMQNWPVWCPQDLVVWILKSIVLIQQFWVVDWGIGQKTWWSTINILPNLVHNFKWNMYLSVHLFNTFSKYYGCVLSYL